MSANEKVLSRIKKLMVLAEKTGNPYEASVALRQAQALMMKYDVTPASVVPGEITSETCRNIPSNALSVPGWLNALVTVVCMTAGCRSYYGWYQHSDHKKRRSVTFYGLGERPAVAGYLFGVVSRQLKRDAEHYLHTACAHPLLKLSTIRRRMDEYRLYWVAGVWTVLESFEPETSEKVLLDRWLTQQQRNLTPAKVRQPEGCRNAKKVSQAAWTAGRQAEIYPAMDYRSEEHSLQEVSNG
ncbi:DUF2786 domain-containing protein [Salmonella enterica]|uniref:DUF2786 domain-containing protein n=1 Tax=Enterobacteriaceae TaxID=543 RepID=UPI000D56BDA0|nr:MULTISPECIES: DUF2786 domain-containing protein [Enterobacteriaceae]EAA5614903.1 DUF2786 domain-containing protein [Salmonella enterica subsp. enterica serovar Bredeney]EAO6763516.1 DUF2786 domain-containing protein [Salmonella enterica]EBU7714723.1 DUF2786 domain-containing protein [Salmonella enterica subsp. enterica serovar Thompson]ECU9701825.1 DUF2786 domain-containing protein [Salmonella enterica subsp. enterica serovar Panama]EDF6785636.1 DUF2786 domain-containing protein [Salmonella